MKTLIMILTTVLCSIALAQAPPVKITQLPLVAGNVTNPGDSIPIGNAISGVTQRIVLSDLPLIPSIAAALTVQIPSQAGQAGKVLSTNGTNTQWITVSGVGSVTSVGLSAPPFLTVSGSPVTASGTLALGLATQVANTVFSGPSSGADAAPTFRALSSADLPLGTPSTFVGYDSGGALNPIPGWQITSENGLLEVTDVDPAVNGNINQIQGDFIPTTPTTNYRNTLEIISNVDPDNSGIKIGDDTGGGVNTLNIDTNHQASGEVGSLSIINGFHNLGDGTGGHLHNWAGVSNGGEIHTGYQLDNYRAFADYPRFDAGSTVGSINMSNMNPEFNGTITGFVSDYSSFPNFKAGSTTAHYHGIENGGGSGVDNTLGGHIDDYIGYNSYLDYVDINDASGIQFSPDHLTVHNSMTAYSSFISNSDISQNLTLMNLGGDNTNVIGELMGINIDLSQITANSNQKIGLSINDGAIGVNSNMDTSINTPDFEFQMNQLGGELIIAAGHPVSSGQFGFGNNIGVQAQFLDDYGPDTFTGTLGFSDVGFVDQFLVAAGKTVHTYNYMLAGGSVPDLGQGVGNATNLNMYSALGVVSAGGSVNITNLTGFHVQPTLCALSPTNCWAFKSDDPNADVSFAKNMIIGTGGGLPTVSGAGIELNSTTKGILFSRMSTVQKNAVVATEGLEVFDTDLHEFDCYSSGSWTACGGGGSANTALSNLTSTAINQSLIWDTDVTYTLGDASHKTNIVYANNVGSDISGVPYISFGGGTGQLMDSSNVSAEDWNSRQLTDPSGVLSLSWATPGTLDINTGNIQNSGNIVSAANATYTLGAPGNLWNIIYANNIGSDISGAAYVSFGGNGLQLVDSSNVASIDANTRQLLNSGGSPVMTWGTGVPDFQGLTITNISDPTNPQDAASKFYVDTHFSSPPVADAATTAALPAYTQASQTLTATTNGQLIIDGNAMSAGQTILVKNEDVSPQFNGFYSVTDEGSPSTPYILTRAAPFNADHTLSKGLSFFIATGSINTNMSFFIQQSPGALDVDPVELLSTPKMLDQSGAQSIDAVNRIIYNSSSVGVLDFQNLQLNDPSNVPSFNWNTRIASDNAGATAFDFNLPGVLILHDHIESTGTIPNAAATGNAGAGSSCSVTGTDMSGQVTLNTGTVGFLTGDQCDVTFNLGYGNAPNCTVTPYNGSAAQASPNLFINSVSSSFSVNFVNPDVGPNTYIWAYHCEEAQ